MKTTLSVLAGIVGAVIVLLPATARTQQKTLDIYFLDMEGGGGTIIVSPSRESILIDAGWPGARDAERITAAAKDAGLKQFDYFVASHFHLDHIGSVAEVAARVPIRVFVDHGDPVDPQTGKSGEVMKSVHRYEREGASSAREARRQDSDRGN